MRLSWSHDAGHEFDMLTYHEIMITSIIHIKTNYKARLQINSMLEKFLKKIPIKKRQKKKKL